MKPDPIRWRDPRSGMPTGLRQSLEELRDQPVDELAVHKLKARLQHEATLATTRLRATKRFVPSPSIWLVTGLLALLGAGVLQRRQAQRPTAAASAASAAERPSASLQSHVPPPPPQGELRAEPVAQPQHTAVEARGRQDVAKRISPPRRPADELTLLTQAQSALQHDAARTLERTATHARLYPHGIFEQEREMLAIEALFKLDRTAQATARANVFLARYPESPHAHGLRALLDRRRNAAAQ